jgi:N-acetylglucosamine-6-phosphate deacetylase
MSDLLVRGGEVVTPTGRVVADIVVRSGRIASVGAGDDQIGEVLDATGTVVAPGLVDLQCNGALGVDLAAEPERLWELAAALPRWGVTAWLPTIVTSPAAIRRRALDTLAAGPDDAGDAVVAEPLGLHFEGPFLAPERRGAHSAGLLRPPDREAITGWSREAGVALVTLAPELPGALDLVRELVDRGVVVSLGHSSATAAEATASVDAGARWVTHLFNAMVPLRHRDPGLPGVALTDERLAVGLIADGLHLHPTVVDVAARALGSRLTLVTDAVGAMGLAPGPVRIGAVEAVADDVGVRLADGTLAGSLLSLDRAVANLTAYTRVSLDDALAAASRVPATVLGQADQRGTLAAGARGDLVLLDAAASANAEVIATVIGGTVAYDRRHSSVR